VTVVSAVQRGCTISGVAPMGDYVRLRLHAPEIAAGAQPGQFVAVAVGGETSSLLLRRAFAVYRTGDGNVDVVVDAHGAGTRWLVAQQPGTVVDVVGPLGRPFPDPSRDGPVVVVAGGYGAAALIGLVSRMRGQGRAVTAVIGAASARRLVAIHELEGLGAEVLVATDDGSAGTRGLVTDLLSGSAAAAMADSAAVYACGPMPMLAATSAAAGAAGVPVWVSVEESMACGIGVCMTCVLPVVDTDGQTRMLRACVSGPTFDGAAVRWADVGTVPADCVGAPSPARAGTH
jgi:dihydroorotate dehydrogenase electron transfer subunit